MPVTGWHAQAIRRLFSGTLPGDWGDEGDPDTGVAVLRSTNFRDDGSIDYGDLAFRSIAAARLEKRGIHRGTILIEKAGGSSTRPAGRVVYCDRDFDGTASNFVEIVRVAQQYVPQYVFYLLYWNYHAGRVHKYQQQTTGIINFKLCEYSDEEVLVPAKTAEQSKIAEVLSAVDRAIEQTEALIAKQQRIKTGLMQDLLTRGIDEHGNLRSEQTHKFKDSPLGRIPMEWESASLAVFVPSAEYGISTSLGESGYPVLRMNNLLDGEAELSDLKFTDAPVPEHLWLRDGDVLFNRTNSWEHVGRTGIWRGQIESATFASYLVRLNPHPDKLLPEMLNFWLNWEQIQIAMRRQATPAVQQVNINPTNLRSIPAAFPRNLDEQTEITVRISTVREVLNAYREHLYKLNSMKAGLMQDLLTGDRRVTALLEQSDEVTT